MENKVCYLCIMEYIQLCNYNGEKGMLGMLCIMEYIQLCNYNGEKGMLLMYNGVYTII